MMPTQGHGRKVKQERVLAALRAGNTRRAAAAYAEVDPKTFYRWIEADATFCHSVEKAEADAEVRHVAQITKAASEGTWQASAWWLERRRHEDWKRREQREVTGKDGGAVLVADVGVARAELGAELARLAAAVAAGGTDPEPLAEDSGDPAL